MNDAAKRGRPSNRDVNVLNDEESAKDQPTERSVKREEESLPSAQVDNLQQETKAESELVLKNDAVKTQLDKLRKENAELQARSGMNQETAADVVDRMEMMGKTSFMDLPDDIHIRFFKDLDFRSCLKLRLNKRLDGLQMCVKKAIPTMRIKISSDHYELALGKVTRPTLRQYHNFHLLVQGLNRLSLNTSLNVITLKIVTNEHNCRIIEALSNFETRCLFVTASRLIPPSINLSTLLNLALNVRDVYIPCTSISAQDLCTLRKIMLEDECKLNFFKMKIDGEMEKSFVKECFGVIIEEVNEPEGRIRTKIYRTANESIEFYGDVFSWYDHFEEGLQTTIGERLISFKKITDGARYVSKKIEMNHLHSYY